MDDARGDDPRKYVKLAAVLRVRISTGKFALGEKLPTVAALAEEQAVSKQTVTKALHLLVGEGVLTPVMGMGFYVRTRPPSSIDE